MTDKEIFRIDDEAITAGALIDHLKLSHEFQEIMRRFVRHKILVKEARADGVAVSPEELQQAADDYRRCFGLHQAKDTLEWLRRIGVDETDFETYIADLVYSRKMTETILNDVAIADYFRRHSPKFETVDIRRMEVEGLEKASELKSLIEETPERFSELATAHAVNPRSGPEGDILSGLTRDMLPGEWASRVFSAAPGAILGPFDSVEGRFVLVQIVEKKPPVLDDATRDKIAEMIYEEWMAARLSEHDTRLD